MTIRQKAPTKELTETRVQRLRPTGKLYRVWDLNPKGFHVQVTPAGAKSYRIQFQSSNGDKVCVTLGEANKGVLESTRKWAIKLREIHKKGGDVRAHVIKERSGDTVKALVELWREDYREKLKPSTARSYDSILKSFILDKSYGIGKRLVRDLDYATVKTMHRKVSKDYPTGANRAVELLSRLMSIAEKEGWRERGLNPCKGLEKNPERSRNRKLSAVELAKLEAALAKLEKDKKLDPIAADAIRFLALSGLRKDEALSLRWMDIDLDANTMSFTDHKTSGDVGTKVLPLNPQLREILKRRAGQRLGPLVFPGTYGDSKIGGLRKMWLRLTALCGLKDVTPHDLRRGFMTVSVELGYPPAIGNVLLGHSLGKITDTYTHLGTDGILATASKETSAWIAAAMGGEKVKPGVKIEEKKEEATA